MRHNNINNRGFSGYRPISNQRNLNSINNIYEEDNDLNKNIPLREAHKSSKPRSRLVSREEERYEQIEIEEPRQVRKSSHAPIRSVLPSVSRTRAREEEKYATPHIEEEPRDTRRGSHSSNNSSTKRLSSTISRVNSREKDDDKPVEKKDNREEPRGSLRSNTNRSRQSSSSRISSKPIDGEVVEDFLDYNDKEEERSRPNRTSNRRSHRTSSRTLNRSSNKVKDTYREESAKEELTNYIIDKKSEAYPPEFVTTSGDPYDKYRTVSKRLKKEKVEKEEEEGINSYKKVHQDAEETKKGFFKKVFSIKK